MRYPLPSCVILAPDADESLRSLLSDVLGDMGIALRASAMGTRPDVVLALVQREDSVAGCCGRLGMRRGRRLSWCCCPSTTSGCAARR